MTKSMFFKEHKVFVILLSLFVFLVGGYFLYLHKLEAELQAKLDKLRAAAYPVTFEELNKWYSIPEGVENAADVITEAFSYYDQTKYSELEDLPFSYHKILEWESLFDKKKKIAAKYLSDNEKAIELLYKGAGMDYCRYPLDFTKGYKRSYQYIKDLQTGSELLQIEALLSTEAGRSGQVIKSLEGLLGLADSLSDEPSLVSQLIKLKFIYQSVNILEWALNRIDFSDADLKNLEGIFDVKEFPTMYKGLAGERCVFINISGKSPSEIISYIGTGYNINIPSRIWFSELTGLLDIDRGIYLDMMSDYMKIYKLPLGDRMRAIEDTKSKYEAVSGIHFMFHVSCPAVSNCMLMELRLNSVISAARSGIATERYRLAKGEYPEKLSDLVPAYIDAVPMDPFDRKDLKYKRVDKGFVVYSVGEDGVDDGGKDRKDRDPNDPDATYDWPFRVMRQVR